MVVDPVPPQIPIKLQRAGYRFIQILPGSKDPREKKYTTEKNYLADEPGIALWIGHYQSFEWSSRNEADNGLYTHYEGYGNYGILCSDTLAAFDLDTPELIDFTLAEFPELKDAFLLQSGSGKGMHIPFKTDCAKTVPFVDPDTKENIGHIKAKGGYIVGPGCLHPDGGVYRIVNDGEIPFISFDQILERFSAYITKKPREERVVDNKSAFYHTSATLSIDIPIERIWSPVKPVRNGSEIQGAHPVHGSKGGKNFSINTRKNTWHCFPAGTLIQTPDGLRNIEDISEEDTVFSERGNPQRVTTTFKREYSGEIIDIKGPSGIVSVTPGHPILIARCKPCSKNYEPYTACKPNCPRRKKDGKHHCPGNGQPVVMWVDSEDVVKETDFLIYQKNSSSNTTFDLTQYRANDRNRFYITPEEIELNPDIASIIGWYLAEGHISAGVVTSHPAGGQKNRVYKDSVRVYPERDVNFTLSYDEIEEANRIKYLMHEHFGLKCRVYQYESRGTTVVSCGSTVIAKFLKRVFGSGAKQKTMSRCLYSPPTILSGIIRSCFDGDGNNRPIGRNNSHKTYRTVSKKLAHEMHLGLLSLGVLSRIWEHALHKVTIKTGSHAGRIVNHSLIYSIGFYKRRDRGFHWVDGERTYLPISSISTREFHGYVYNLETEDHTYQAPFIVHNCFRDGSGGGSAEAIAVKHGLIDCDDAHPGCLRGDLFRQVLEIAEEEYGWTRPIKTTPVRPTILPEISNATFDIEIFEQTGVHTDILPEDLPENFEALLLDGLPRIGKTHWSEMQAIKHKTANIIANTHSVIDQHLRIFRENRNPGQTAVHLEGRNRCCRMQEGERRSCSRCPLYPYTEDPADRGRFISFVGESLHKSEIITKNDVPDGYCPYFFCKESAKMADYVFTVPDNLEEITGENHQSRHLTIIDEDTCFPSFFPQSVDLAEFVRGPTRNYVVNLVEMKWIGIQKWKDYIVEKKKRPKGKATILKMIEILENIREILRIKDDVVFTPSEILHDVSLVDLNIPEPTDITKPELLRAIERWEIPDTFSLFAKALLYPYKEKTLDWQGYNPMKLRLIANEEERIYEPPNTKMILIGSTRAEMFLKTLDVKYDAIRINKFQYSKNFVFFVVKGKSGRGNARKWNFRNAVKTALKRVAKTNSDTRYPLLVLVGTKKEQSNIMEDLGGICKGSSDENIQGQRWNYIGGFFNIFYQNSVISRGVDIPFYKTLIVYSSDFANPYWLAKMKVAIENKDRDGAEYAESVMDAITVDETTNSSLRVTPVVGHTDTIPRVVVISEKDLWKIKPVVLSEAQVVEVEAEQLFDNFEKILNCSGRLEILPEREDVDEFNRNVIHWGVDTVFDEPEAIRNLPVEAKGEFYAKTIVRSEGDEDAWRHRYRPDVIKEVEDSVVRYLVHLDKTGKTTRFNSLKEYISKRNKKFKPTLVNDVIMGLYKMGSIRIDNIAKDTTAAIVRISSVYVDKELEEKGRS